MSSVSGVGVADQTPLRASREIRFAIVPSLSYFWLVWVMCVVFLKSTTYRSERYRGQGLGLRLRVEVADPETLLISGRRRRREP